MAIDLTLLTGPVLGSSSANTHSALLKSMASNLVNTSAMNATSATLYFNQLQGASSAINQLLTQCQVGLKVSG